MSLLHPRYRQLRRVHAQVISLIFTGVFIVSLLLSTLVFNISLRLFQNSITTIEHDLNINLTWDGIRIHPNGTITISNLQIKRSTSNKTIAAIEKAVVKINYQRLREYLFRPYDTLIEHDKTYIEKKDLQYSVIKSLTAVSLTGMFLEIETAKDLTLFQTMFQYSFVHKILPERATFSIERADGIVSLSQMQAELSDIQLNFLITDTTGISGTYAASVWSRLLTNQISLQVDGLIQSNPEALFSVSYKNTFSNMNINDFLTLQPFTLQFNTSEEKVDIILESNNKLVTVQGTLDEQVLQVDADISNVMITQFLRIEDKVFLEHIENDRLYGTGNLRFNFSDNSATYQFSLNNADTTNNIISINISGDEHTLYTNESTISVYNQYFFWDGSLSFEDVSLSGTIAYDVSKPIIDIPMRGKLLFTHNDFNAIARSEFLYINNVEQPPIFIEYNTALQSMNIFLSNQDTPVLSLTRMDTIYDDHPFDKRFREREHTTTIVAKIYEFTPMFLDNIFFKNGNLRIFSDVYFTGTVNVVLKQYMAVESIQAYLTLQYKNHQKDYVQFEGGYTKQSGWNIAGDFKISTIGQFNGNFSLLYPSEYASVQKITASVQVNDQHNKHVTYQIDGDISSKNKMFFSLHNAGSMTIHSQDNVTTIRSRITGLRFIEPSLILSGNINIEVLSGNTINTITGKLLLQHEKQRLFSVEMDYRENRGTISDVYWNIRKNIFSGTGSIMLNPKNQSMYMSIQEKIPSQSTTDPKVLLSNNTLESYQVTYDIKNKLLDMSVKNIPLKYLSEDYLGEADVDVMMMGDISRVDVEVSKGTLILKKQAGRQYHVSGNFTYTPGKYELYDVDISTQKQRLKVDRVFLENGKVLTADFYLQPLQNVNIIPSLDGKITFESDTPIFESVKNLLSKDMNIGTKVSMPDFTSTLLVTPDYPDGRSIPFQYTHSIVITGKDQDIIARDIVHNLYVVRNANGKVYGEFGNAETQALFITFSGFLTRDTINVNTIVHRADIKQLFDDFNIEKATSTDILNLSLQGKLFFRGSFIHPTLWGEIMAQNVNINISTIFSDVQIATLSIRFVNNNINIPETTVMLDGSAINFTGIGQLSNGGLEYMNFDFFTLDNDYATFRNLMIGTMQISGSTRGRLSLNIDNEDIFLGGTLYVKDTQLSIDNKQRRKRDDTSDPLFDTQLFTVSIKTISEEGVLYTWPLPSFPVLRAYLKQDQSIQFDLDSDEGFLYIKGNVEIDNGTLYYLDKGFNITKGAVYLDSYESTVPYLVNFVAVANKRYKNERYTITISAQNTFLNNLQFTIDSSPPLSVAELSNLMGQGFTPAQDTAEINTELNKTLVKALGRITDPLINIGIFSQVEQILARSLKLDYVSFRSKILENLLTYSIKNSDNVGDNVVAITNQGTNYFLPYLFNQSSFEIGKYVRDVYFSFVLAVNTYDVYQSQNDIFNAQINTQLNVELPTPYFDVTWSFNPSSFYIPYRFVPISFLTFSWQKKY